MTIPPESIQPGKCYLATSLSGVRLRRVLEITADSRVLYEQHTRRTGWRSVVGGRSAFAVAIEREVPCDWRPEADRS